jgi:hypothetical protein
MPFFLDTYYYFVLDFKLVAVSVKTELKYLSITNTALRSSLKNAVPIAPARFRRNVIPHQDEYSLSYYAQHRLFLLSLDL